VGDFLSRSVELLRTHPHLLDGGLSRALLYAALALILGTRLWLHFRPRLALPLGPVRCTAGGLSLAGLGLALNTLALQAAYPFGTDNMPFFVDAASYRQVLQGAFGITWAVFAALLALALLTLRTPWVWLFGIGMATCIAANSHAGEAGLWSWMMLVDVLHLLLGLTWLGGVLGLVWLRMSGPANMGPELIGAWSRVALPLFLTVLALGGVRLLLEVRAEEGVNVLYGAMLALKIAAILAVMFQAYKLRGLLKRSRFIGRQFDDGLSMELFAAFILILFTALLTQLQPN
jgi:putative copper export protein